MEIFERLQERLPAARVRQRIVLPDGHPRGLCAGDDGMLEVGFQSPAGHTAVPFERAPDGGVATSLVTSSLAPRAAHAAWTPAFPQRSRWRHLDAEYAALGAGQALPFGSPAFESALVVASGEIEIDGPARRRVTAFGVVHLAAVSAVSLRAAAPSTLLVAVKARAAAAR